VKGLLACLAAAFVLVPSASAMILSGPKPPHSPSAAPHGLHAFLLRPDEAAQPYYPRTPSFAWNPVAAQGGTYDFELATSRTFSDPSVLYSYSKLQIPAVAVAHQLPWMTGEPYALWAHVRWESANGKIVTPWSTPFGFNLRWTDDDFPQQEPAPPGLIRWKPIEGATAYQVLYPQLHESTPFETSTNVADEREFYTFKSPPTTITWRVRAVRYIAGQDKLKNGLPIQEFGPWSRLFSSPTSYQAETSTPTPSATVSDKWDKPGRTPAAHELTPGFAWTPSPPVVDPAIGDVGSSLYRVYVFSDDHCVNQIFTGSIVGSPAFAPRMTGGTLQLPQDMTAVAAWRGSAYSRQTGSEGRAVDATGLTVQPNEAAGSSAPTDGTPVDAVAQVDLWDSGWPTGRFYWTVVPVSAELDGTAPAATTTGKPSTAAIEYHDTALPQDQCEAGFGMGFGKVSAPVVTSAGTPFVSGLAPDGRVVASVAKVPQVHDSPLVAWRPAVGATTYDIELSRQRYPWKKTWSTTTAATSVVLPLGTNSVGTWWYRVRGFNPELPAGAQDMSWSTPVRIKVTGDRFVLVK